jgi:hypothetical protein
MISLLIIISLSLFPNSIYSSVQFTLNPNCDPSVCDQTGHPALYYANNSIGDDVVHMVYSSFDALTISIFQTKKTDILKFNYDALFAGNYSAAIQFDTKPIYSFSLVLRRLIEFNDANDNGRMDDNDNETMSYFLNNATITNETLHNLVTNQPTFQIPIELVNKKISLYRKNIFFSFRRMVLLYYILISSILEKQSVIRNFQN